MKRLLAALSLSCVMLFLLGGCIGHYRITDPASGDVYYTREWKMEGDDKTEVRFKDVLTERVYLVEDPEIKSISRKDYAAATE